MDLDSIAAFLEKTVDDGRLSRGERSAFRDALDKGDPDERERAWIRSKAFDIARERADGPKTREAFDWLESVIHLMADHGADAPASVVADVHFSPGEACLRRLRDLVTNARRSVDICVFTITDDRISGAILDAHRRGVKVRIVSDNDKANDLGSDVDGLKQAGVPVAVDTSPYHMHHKYAIFDGRLLLNGSFNWTRSATTSNEENIMVTDDDRLIEPFRAEFDKMWRTYAQG